MAVVKAATTAQLDEVVEKFRRATRVVIDAGFDAIEIHLGHNYLPSSFLSPNLNKRRDDYGGSIENRLANIGRSFVQGHEQGLRHGRKPYPGNINRLGVVAGSFYQHCESYRGPQGRDEWRGCVVINEVQNGDGDLMPLSMSYLSRKYG